MNVKKIIALLLAALLVLSLAACGTKTATSGDMSGNGSAMTGEPKNRRGGGSPCTRSCWSGRTRILSENTESLWEKVFMAADKGMTMQEDGKNYGDFLLDTIESAKEQVYRRGA